MRLQTSGKYKFKRKGLPKLTPKHRAVMHEIGPREDEDSLVVHHIDGNKSNNDPTNLMWMSRPDHSRLHIWAKTISRALEK